MLLMKNYMLHFSEMIYTIVIIEKTDNHENYNLIVKVVLLKYGLIASEFLNVQK